MPELRDTRPVRRKAQQTRDLASHESVLARLYPIAAMREQPGREMVRQDGYDIGAVMEVMDFAPEQLGNALGVSAKTVLRWKQSQHIPDREAQEKVARLAYAWLLLADLVGLAEAKRWSWTPNPLFGGETPRALIQGGKVDRIIEILSQLDEGIPD